jgi:thiol peroxidase
LSVERKGLIEFRGQEVTVVGEDLRIGDQAPDFSVQTTDWEWMDALKATEGKVRILGSLPSLSTGVCDRETKRFNSEAGSLGSDVAILMVSMDLPWTINNWCAGAGVEQVVTLSDHRNVDFGEKYGVLLKELRIFRRAIFVLDRKGKVVYVEYTPSLGVEPDYSLVLEAARKAL